MFTKVKTALSTFIILTMSLISVSYAVSYNPSLPITGIMVTANSGYGNRCPSGTEWLATDLNKGAGGAYVHLCLYREPNRAGALTDLTIVKSGERCPTGFGMINVDLNFKSSKSKYIISSDNPIYLCTKFGSSVNPIRSIEITTSKSYSGNLCKSSYSRVNFDLNKGVGGDYIFLCYKR